METIPKIIHQIWSDKYKPLPYVFKELAQTWIDMYPEWEYMYWDEKKMNDYMKEEYPQYCKFYYNLPFDVQRWDMIRFLIFDKMGGMYVDFDYESIENLEPLLEGKTFCVALEPAAHCKMYNREYVLTNAFMASVPAHPFIKKVIERICSDNTLNYDRQNKPMYILNTTGPLFLSDLYTSLTQEEKDQIYLMPAKYVTPFNANQAYRMQKGEISEELEDCLKDAYAVHYFANAWLPALKE